MRKIKAASTSIEGWAVAVLLDTHAIAECESHGFVRDRADPDAWQRARLFANQNPFRGASKKASVQAIDDVMNDVGDTCPECDSAA